jgi:hypothetical protein
MQGVCVGVCVLPGGCERRVHRSTPPREVGGAHGLQLGPRRVGHPLHVRHVGDAQRQEVAAGHGHLQRGA